MPGARVRGSQCWRRVVLAEDMRVGGLASWTFLLSFCYRFNGLLLLMLIKLTPSNLYTLSGSKTGTSPVGLCALGGVKEKCGNYILNIDNLLNSSLHRPVRDIQGKRGLGRGASSGRVICWAGWSAHLLGNRHPSDHASSLTTPGLQSRLGEVLPCRELHLTR